MRIYTCIICGYVYEESLGIPDSDIAPGTKWEKLPEGWICPICTATKENFTASDAQADSPEEKNENIKEVDNVDISEKSDSKFSDTQLSALFSNLAKACEKQYLTEEMELFNKLAVFYTTQIKPATSGEYQDLEALLSTDAKELLPTARKLAESSNDRGANRAVTWSEKVSAMVKSLLQNKESSTSSIEGGASVYVCEICGFVFVGNDVPEVCPVCKVPKTKINKVGR